MKKIIFFSFFIAILFSSKSFCFEPEEHLPNAKEEQRAINLFTEIKCLVCQGQSIESSNTAFSYEMRKLIRSKIAKQKTDAQIKQELVLEFGDEILFSTQNTTPLWLIFAFAILLALLFFFHFFQKA